MAPGRVVFGQQRGVGPQPAAVPHHVHAHAAAHHRLAPFEAPCLYDAHAAGRRFAETVVAGDRHAYDVAAVEGPALLRAVVHHLQGGHACARAVRKAVDHFGPGHVVHHAREVYVEAARIGEAVHEECRGVHIVDPHAAAAGAHLVDHALHGAARYHILLEQACVELGQAVAAVDAGGVGVIVFAGRGQVAVTAHDGLDEAAYQIVGLRPLAGRLHQAPLAHHVAAAVGHDVAPLVAVGILLVALAAGAQHGGRLPCLAGAPVGFIVFLHNTCRL